MIGCPQVGQDVGRQLTVNGYRTRGVRKDLCQVDKAIGKYLSVAPQWTPVGVGPVVDYPAGVIEVARETLYVDYFGLGHGGGHAGGVTVIGGGKQGLVQLCKIPENS